MSIDKKIVLSSLIASLTLSSLGANTKTLICDEDPESYRYCESLKKFHYIRTSDMDNIMYMTDNLQYLKRDRDKFKRELAKKIYQVMKDINKTIKIGAAAVKTEKYRSIRMVVVPVKYGSSRKIRYQDDMAKMTGGELRHAIDDFYKQYEEHDDDFLTDLLTGNGSKFIILPEIVQYDKMVAKLQDSQESDFEVAIDGSFGLEKGMSESIVTLALKVDKNGKIRRVFDKKTEYQKIKKVLIELLGNALEDIASQDE
jgi:hypothetical protein